MFGVFFKRVWLTTEQQFLQYSNKMCLFEKLFISAIPSKWIAVFLIRRIGPNDVKHHINGQYT